MLKNKAQIARESIKITLELLGPLSGPWTPAESELGSTLVMCVWAHNLLRPPPPPLNENPGSAPANEYKMKLVMQTALLLQKSFKLVCPVGK